MKPKPEIVDELKQWLSKLLLISPLVRLEPIPVIVVSEFSQEFE